MVANEHGCWRIYSKRWCPRMWVHFNWWILYLHSSATAFAQMWVQAGEEPCQPEHSLSLIPDWRKSSRAPYSVARALPPPLPLTLCFLSQLLSLSPGTSLHHLLLYLSLFNLFFFSGSLSLCLLFIHNFHYCPNLFSCHWEDGTWVSL